jgi:peptide/nickel transport system permease protein
LLALTLVGAAVIGRFQRAAMRDVVGAPFLRTARAKGLTERAVRRHAVRASLLPVIALGGVYFQTLLCGAVFVEVVFSWPGLGDTLLSAIHKRDYDLVTACVVLGSAMATIGNMLADMLCQVADPRLRRST